MIKVSIVVPIYNVEKYLVRCLDSLANQTLKEIEIIIVNDGSTDNSAKICRQYAENYLNFRYIEQKNQGLSGARNTGIKHAKGEFVGFVDSDDFVKEDMFELLYSNALKNDVGISCCGFMTYYTDGTTVIKTRQGIEKKYSRDEALDQFLLDKYFDVISWNKIFRRELFDDIKFPVGKIYEDILTIYKLIDLAGGLYFDSTPEYYYYKRGDSISNSSSCSKTMRLVDYVDDYVEYCRRRVKKPKYLYIGQILWYLLILNRLYCVGQYEKELTNKTRGMIRQQLSLVLFTNKIGVVGKLKIILLLIMPKLYSKIYVKASRRRNVSHSGRNDQTGYNSRDSKNYNLERSKHEARFNKSGEHK